VRTGRRGNAKVETRLGAGRRVRRARLSVRGSLRVVASAKVVVLVPDGAR
jgi:hypothetical protein